MENIEIVGDEVRKSLAELSDLFQPEAKLTFVMRVPDYPNRYMVVSDDDLDGVITVLKEKSD